MVQATNMVEVSATNPTCQSLRQREIRESRHGIELDTIEGCSPAFVGALLPSQVVLSNASSVGRARFGCGDCAGEAGRLPGRGEDSDSAEVTDDMLEPLK